MLSERAPRSSSRTQQIAGCFKPRGIVNKILSLSDREKAEGLVTVSGGNHGIAIAEIAPTMDTRATVVMPQSAPASSIARIRASGADLILAPDSARAFEIAESDEYRSLTYIHSYDDPLIMAGHGTVGLEFINDVPDLTDIPGEHRRRCAHFGDCHRGEGAESRGADLGGGDRRGRNR